jgi:biotin carboxyl carrier protein
VLDLRSLVPLDREAIVSSVRKTGRLVVVGEDYLSFGLPGEVVASVTDVDPSLLRAPVARVAAPDVPVRTPAAWSTRSCPRRTASRRRAGRGPPPDRGAHPGAVAQGSAAPGILTTWFVTEGERVRAGQVLAEVQVDKVAADVPAPAAGIVPLLVAEEAEVRPRVPIARIA